MHEHVNVDKDVIVDVYVLIVVAVEAYFLWRAAGYFPEAEIQDSAAVQDEPCYLALSVPQETDVANWVGE